MHIRPYAPATDECFVLNSFMKSFVIPRLSTIEHAPSICKLDGKTIIDYWHDWMMVVLARGESIVSCDDEDPVFILGWLARYGDELAYVYTRKLARRRGVAKSLFAAAKLDPATCPRRFSTREYCAAFRS